ncbi:MAG TPA: FAD-binding protein, partial [Gemmatimonadaceae bacterium]
MTATASDQGLIEKLEDIVTPRFVMKRESDLLVYNSDGLPGYRRMPRIAVFPGNREEAVAVVRTLAAQGVAFVPRGAGTGLSGGALADDVVLLGMHRLKRIISIDAANLRAVVEPGVVNLHVNRAVAHLGLLYAPDPSSEAACTIGGNIAENAGGPHCLKYGVTLNHVIAMTVILPDGEIVTLG